MRKPNKSRKSVRIWSYRHWRQSFLFSFFCKSEHKQSHADFTDGGWGWGGEGLPWAEWSTVQPADRHSEESRRKVRFYQTAEKTFLLLQDVMRSQHSAFSSLPHTAQHWGVGVGWGGWKQQRNVYSRGRVWKRREIQFKSNFIYGRPFLWRIDE